MLCCITFSPSSSPSLQDVSFLTRDQTHAPCSGECRVKVTGPCVCVCVCVCVCICCRFLLCGSHEFWYSDLYIYKQDHFKFSIIWVCTLLMIAVLILYLCVDAVLSLLYAFLYQWAFLFVVFLFAVVPPPLFSRPREVPLVFCKTVLVVLNSFSFCLSVKLLISPSNLSESLAGYSIAFRFFHFSL